jgi:aconitate hydratase
MFGVSKKGDIDYTETLELDLDSVRPSVSGPKRPQDRIELGKLKSKFTDLFAQPVANNGFAKKADDLPKRFKNKDGIEIGSGDVLIAAITSCTNTSNPSVLLAAGLLAKKAVEKGLTVRSHIKTSLAPGSRVVTDYLTASGLLPYLEKLNFYVSGYGCTTCIGNAGPCRKRSTSPSSRTTSSAPRCSRATATSRRASTRTCARTSSPRRRSSSPTRSPALC